MFRLVFATALAFAAILAVGLVAAPALADDGPASAETQVVIQPTEAEPAAERRLTRVERWRGKPYVARYRGIPEGGDEGRLLVDSQVTVPASLPTF